MKNLIFCHTSDCAFIKVMRLINYHFPIQLPIVLPNFEFLQQIDSANVFILQHSPQEQYDKLFLDQNFF